MRTGLRSVEREKDIQNLLRHAFRCLQNSNCSCSENIKEFLQKDKVSLGWAKKQEEKQR